MLKDVYSNFNTRHYRPEKHRQLLAEIIAEIGDPGVRMCETPVFLPRPYVDQVVQGATEIIQQALAPELRKKLDEGILPEFRLPHPPEHPSFFIIDFAVTEEGPKLIEMQAFAANLCFIPAVAEMYKRIYGLGDKYQYLLSDMSAVKKTILGDYSPEDVVLMEINPWRQLSQRDFEATQNFLHIPIVDVTQVFKEGNQLFYTNNEGKTIRIRRIYNRVVPGEFLSLDMAKKIRFQFTDDLDVEWLGDLSWFMRVSKYTMPFLKHPMVPETRFLDQIDKYPPDLENYVLKPVFRNAGAGVKIDITAKDLDAILPGERHGYVLMKKVRFMPFIPSPGVDMLNAEIRVMFVWPDKLTPVALSARVMHGNNTNASLWGNDFWCGLTPVMFLDGEE